MAERRQVLVASPSSAYTWSGWGNVVDVFVPNNLPSESAQRATLRGNTRQAHILSSGGVRFVFFSEFAIVRKNGYGLHATVWGETWSHANPERRLRRQGKRAKPMPVKSNVNSTI